jgi:hypothetical protein
VRRTTEALDHYQRLRRLLSEELGIDPGRPLQELHQRILSTGPAPATEVPRQLPAAPRIFVGRATDLSTVEQAASEMNVAVVSGAAGIGKTWLVLRWAHENLDRFPDGQLYLNLRGFDPDSEPVPPDVVLRGVLDSLGVAPRSALRIWTLSLPCTAA